MEYGLLFVVLMGMGTVFFGLICIIYLTTIMGKVMKTSAKPAPAVAAAAPAAAPAPKKQEMQPEIVAVITAVLSEEVGVSASNIVNIKKI